MTANLFFTGSIGVAYLSRLFFPLKCQLSDLYFAQLSLLLNMIIELSLYSKALGDSNKKTKSLLESKTLNNNIGLMENKHRLAKIANGHGMTHSFQPILEIIILRPPE